MSNRLDPTGALWKKVVAFHGHECGGLTIGYQAALYAAELLGTHIHAEPGHHHHDEEIVCIAENDSCSVDAVQVLLGCSIGQGNLLFHLRGKQAYTFYNRQNGKGVRLLLRRKSQPMTREESFAYYQNHDCTELFDAMEPRLPLPERAQLFGSFVCESCGELTGEHWLRLRDGKKLCLDCWEPYRRFDV